MTAPASEGLSCRELVELVTDYLEDALVEAERARFEAHILACDGCSAYLAQMRETIRSVGRLTEEDIEPGAREELLSIFRAWRTETPQDVPPPPAERVRLADRVARWLRRRREP